MAGGRTQLFVELNDEFWGGGLHEHALALCLGRILGLHLCFGRESSLLLFSLVVEF